MAVRVGINGFGRIGRCVLRAAAHESDVEFVALNDITDAATLAHLLKYDSTHGTFDEPVEVTEGGLRIGGIAGREIRVLAERDPGQLPWGELGCDVVIESTGLFTKRPDAAKHLEAGARKVIISAPATEPDVTVALGVNEEAYDPANHHVLSNASCTTNCLAPVAKVLLESYGISRGWMTTIHAYTGDQRLLDAPHRDLRRARSAAISMVPTSTGAARAVGLVLPALAGKLDGIAIRVPTFNVSVVDLVCELERDASAEQVNESFRKAASGPLGGILRVCDEPLVSIDFRGDPHSSIVDAPNTRVMDRRLVKVLAWYDNEWGYARRVIDLVRLVGTRL
jgi:glyceraldehyde 3-phosphate dehydrogenase